VKEDEAKYNA
jgi:hypothetical protein